MKPPLKIKFTDYYRGWDNEQNLFTKLLAEMYDVSFSDDPDLLIFLPFGTDHLSYQCRKLFITGENVQASAPLFFAAASCDREKSIQRTQAATKAVHIARCSFASRLIGTTGAVDTPPVFSTILSMGSEASLELCEKAHAQC